MNEWVNEKSNQWTLRCSPSQWPKCWMIKTIIHDCEIEQRFSRLLKILKSYFNVKMVSQLTFSCSKSTIKTLEEGMKYVQV